MAKIIQLTQKYTSWCNPEHYIPIAFYEYCLVYGNTFLYCFASIMMEHLKRVQHSTTQLVTHTYKCKDITPESNFQHCIPIKILVCRTCFCLSPRQIPGMTYGNRCIVQMQQPYGTSFKVKTMKRKKNGFVNLFSNNLIVYCFAYSSLLKIIYSSV